MALVTSSSFSILVNGSPSEIFSASRGLRKGYPLSHFLFILMMEGLGRSINRAKVSGKIKGLQLTENGQAMTHQKFVDDAMLQGNPTVKEASAYKQILNNVSLATGMEVNLSKSKKKSLILTLQFKEISPEFWAFKESPSHQTIWEFP